MGDQGFLNKYHDVKTINYLTAPIVIIVIEATDKKEHKNITESVSHGLNESKAIASAIGREL